MTYPPQPGQPYGQQPDPYGQGGYPQSGGFPQSGGQQQPAQYPNQPYPNQPYQGQQYPGQQYPQYPQQQHQYPGQQQYPAYDQSFGGPPAPPKKKSKTGLWIGIVVVVVLLIAFGVTGFFVPGFLVKNSAAGPDATAQALADALGKRDTAALNSLKCGNPGENVGLAIQEISKVKAATLAGPPTRVTDTEDTAIINVTTSSMSAPFTVTFADQNGQWCWKDIARGGGGPTTGSPPTTG
jgi:hypothetical protein